ncbi:MAG TPA: CDP-alcohol phosphatidyltransferase family protein [Bacteroidales bacterium]|nr:CDP-alcohol phosphatidyltransferase family protein [Bacteroidales bacterium]HOK74275.1 CDP-alcohol phosphatidyltransferase family protein [Bacteroidales bacterium]HPP92863.1 CDP-alcohol phosphatidyltransferase family protein [Bacteroidales bacterium]HRR17363.1 CDP-alcohol phosphatidyltransferase family protein [Bacteroidales bacterium]HRU57511.1 CDP-alcohol phosphatidyltransferase family protein [Bacteroidales bacterium]
MEKQKIWTIPNIITFYRLLAFPVILFFILTKNEKLFVVFLIINLLSDAIDGYIARKFKMETEFGARLDSIADNLTYILAFTGIFVFKLKDLMPYIVSLSVYIGLLIITVALSLVKFKRFPSLHLYATKINGYVQGVFMICLFTVGLIPLIYYTVIILGIIGAVESIVIQLIISEMRSNVKGLYWVIRERKKDFQAKTQL